MDAAPPDTLLRASRHPLAADVLQGFRRCVIAPGDRLVLAVSGGSDSTALLVLAAALWERSERGLENLSVVAVDHGLREESAREADAAVRLALGIGIARAEVRRVQVPKAGNLLDSARGARLGALLDAASSFGAPSIALGHQADDCAEGVLIGLERGGGIDALMSLVPRREFADGIALCRPLLRIRRQALRDFLRTLEIPWCEDPSNELRSRGRMRGDPSLAALVDRIAAGSARLAEDADELSRIREDGVERILADGAHRIDRAEFDAMPSVIRREALARLARGVGASISQAVIDSFERIPGGDTRPRCFRLDAETEIRISSKWIEARMRSPQHRRQTQPSVTED